MGCLTGALRWPQGPGRGFETAIGRLERLAVAPVLVVAWIRYRPINVLRRRSRGSQNSRRCPVRCRRTERSGGDRQRRVGLRALGVRRPGVACGASTVHCHAGRAGHDCVADPADVHPQPPAVSPVGLAIDAGADPTTAGSPALSRGTSVAAPATPPPSGPQFRARVGGATEGVTQRSGQRVFTSSTAPARCSGGRRAARPRARPAQPPGAAHRLSRSAPPRVISGAA